MNNDSIEKLLKSLKSTLAKKENEKKMQPNSASHKFVAKTAKTVDLNDQFEGGKNKVADRVEKVIDSYFNNHEFLNKAVDNFLSSDEFATLIEKKLLSREEEMQKILNQKIANIFNKND